MEVYYLSIHRTRVLHFIQRNSLADISLDGRSSSPPGEEVMQIKQGLNVANPAFPRRKVTGVPIKIVISMLAYLPNVHNDRRAVYLIIALTLLLS